MIMKNFLSNFDPFPSLLSGTFILMMTFLLIDAFKRINSPIELGILTTILIGMNVFVVISTIKSYKEK